MTPTKNTWSFPKAPNTTKYTHHDPAMVALGAPLGVLAYLIISSLIPTTAALFLCNTAGSFLMGWLQPKNPLISMGILGGFTTYSGYAQAIHAPLPNHPTTATLILILIPTLAITGYLTGTKLHHTTRSNRGARN